jgi:hypothetical protein
MVHASVNVATALARQWIAEGTELVPCACPQTTYLIHPKDEYVFFSVPQFGGLQGVGGGHYLAVHPASGQVHEFESGE